MSSAKDLMIVRNTKGGYSDREILEAALNVLSDMCAKCEDVVEAGHAIGYIERRNKAR